MAMSETIVGTKEPTRNSVRFVEVDELKSGTVYEDGRIFISNHLVGEQLEYALTRGGVHSAGRVDGPVVVHDAETMDHAKVLPNGSIHVGRDYSGETVTVAYVVLDDEAKQQIGSVDASE